MVKEVPSRTFLRNQEPFATEDGYEKGRENERRAKSIFEELAEEGFFLRIRKASKQQKNKLGINFIAVMLIDTSEPNPEELHIPFNIKSSAGAVSGAVSGNKNNAKKQGIIYIVVNPDRMDDTIKNDIRKRTKYHLKKMNKIPS